MIIVYNGQENQSPDPLNRGFLYGDGAFETMIYRNGQIRFISDHFDRLRQATGLLKIKPGVSEDSFQRLVQSIALKNNLIEGRLKLIVWRKSGGLFEPEEEAGEWLLIMDKIKPIIPEKRKVKIVTDVRNQYTSLSSYKTLSSSKYILAGLKKKELGADDIILLDEKGHISECLYSNIFWIKNDKVFTPAIETGCIAGVARKHIIGFLQTNLLAFEEGYFPIDNLLNAHMVFNCNVSGLSVLSQIDDIKFNTVPSVFPLIRDYMA